LKLGRDVTLNVNQGNARAVACYRKNGFIIDEEEIIELGDGMINRDYKMRLKAENFKL
jgi:ribosomal protein S18 acetylase RimI-like enzyme